MLLVHQRVLWLDAGQQTTLFQREMTMGQSLASAPGPDVCLVCLRAESARIEGRANQGESWCEHEGTKGAAETSGAELEGQQCTALAA